MNNPQPGVDGDVYFNVRSEWLNHRLDHIVEIERKYTRFFAEVVVEAAPHFYRDFSVAMELLPFWINYLPIQRGRAPTGTSIPWGEVGEKAIGSNLIKAISQKDPTITFPGLPLGGDIRLSTSDALIHFDLKLTGPNDRADEIVASPHQVSGDGSMWDRGVKNSPVNVVGKRERPMRFQPELPPLYILPETGFPVLLCLTFFLKAVYQVTSLGYQPLDYLELVCVPNGLLMFDGPHYHATTPGLLIPGKDELNHPKKRTRIRLDPLASIANWRCVKILRAGTTWSASPRVASTSSGLDFKV